MATSGKVAKLTEHAGAAGASYCDARSGGDNWSSVLSFLIINCLALLEVYWLPICRRCRIAAISSRAMAVVLAPHFLGIEIPGTNNAADSGEPYDRRMRPGETAETLI
jgi:hypothetical protein